TGFDGDGFEIFSAEEDDGFFGTAEDFQAVVECDEADIAGIHPAVFEDLGCGFWIFVVAAHNLGAADVDFAAEAASIAVFCAIGVEDFSGVEVDDADFGFGVGWANGADDKVIPSTDGENGSGFGHSISFKYRNADEVKKFINVGLQGTAA